MRGRARDVLNATKKREQVVLLWRVMRFRFTWQQPVRRAVPGPARHWIT